MFCTGGVSAEPIHRTQAVTGSRESHCVHGARKRACVHASFATLRVSGLRQGGPLLGIPWVWGLGANVCTHSLLMLSSWGDWGHGPLLLVKTRCSILDARFGPNSMATPSTWHRLRKVRGFEPEPPRPGFRATNPVISTSALEQKWGTWCLALGQLMLVNSCC